MATLKDATQLTEGIENLIGDLRSELENGEVDFEKLVSLADQISERADGLAETFSSINDTLMQRLEQAKDGGGGSSNGRSQKSSRKSGSGSSSNG